MTTINCDLYSKISKFMIVNRSETLTQSSEKNVASTSLKALIWKLITASKRDVYQDILIFTFLRMNFMSYVMSYKYLAKLTCLQGCLST